MTRGSKLTNEERIAAVQEYQDGKGSYRAIGEKYGVSDYVIRTLVNRAKSDGIDFVKVSRTNKKRTTKKKEEVVEAAPVEEAPKKKRTTKKKEEVAEAAPVEEAPKKVVRKKKTDDIDPSMD